MSDERLAFLVQCAFDGAVPAHPAWLEAFTFSVEPHHYPITKMPSSEDLAFSCRSCNARFRLPLYARVEGELWTSLESHAASHSVPPVPAVPAAEPAAVP